MADVSLGTNSNISLDSFSVKTPILKKEVSEAPKSSSDIKEFVINNEVLIDGSLLTAGATTVAASKAIPFLEKSRPFIVGTTLGLTASSLAQSATNSFKNGKGTEGLVKLDLATGAGMFAIKSLADASKATAISELLESRKTISLFGVSTGIALLTDGINRMNDSETGSKNFSLSGGEIAFGALVTVVSAVSIFKD